VESVLQKFTNINSDPSARAFVEIADALLEDAVKKVCVVAHSQGTTLCPSREVQHVDRSRPVAGEVGAR
jgi:hypothetical protein